MVVMAEFGARNVLLGACGYYKRHRISIINVGGIAANRWPLRPGAALMARHGAYACHARSPLLSYG